MSEEELETRVEHRSRTDQEVEAALARARRMHVDAAHDGDADACRCELTFHADEDIVAVNATTDADGLPLAVIERRMPMTSATWKTPKTTEDER